MEWLGELLRLSNKALENSKLFILAVCSEETASRLPTQIRSRTTPCGFHHRIPISIPEEPDRRRIIHDVLKKANIATSEPANEIATKLSTCTSGYNFIELEGILSTAAMKADLKNETLGLAHFIDVVKDKRPNRFIKFDSKSGDNMTISWDDVGGCVVAKERLSQLLRYQWEPNASEGLLGFSSSNGILLHGPSGCGKTLIANTIAKTLRCTFLAFKASELSSKYLGESERLIREVFKKARQKSPTILFLDEIDAIASRRNLDGSTEG